MDSILYWTGVFESATDNTLVKGKEHVSLDLSEKILSTQLAILFTFWAAIVACNDHFYVWAEVNT